MNISRFMQALRECAVDPHWCALYHGGGGKGQPAAPDYTGAAQQQAAASKEIATQNTWANRPTINTPFGSQTWEAAAGTDPSTGQPITDWTTNINLNPDQQAALDSQQRVTTGRSQAAETLLDQATGAFQKPFDWEGQPAVPGSVSDAQDKAYQTMSAELEPGRTRQRDALDTKLANSGLSRDAEAFKRSQQDLSDQFTQQDKSVLSQSMAEGRADIGAQQSLRQQSIAEEAQRRGMTLNELNALLTGQQVNMPNMPNVAPATKAETPQLLNAAQMQGQYGLDAANTGTDWGSLIGSGAMAVGTAM